MPVASLIANQVNKPGIVNSADSARPRRKSAAPCFPRITFKLLLGVLNLLWKPTHQDFSMPLFQHPEISDDYYHSFLLSGNATIPGQWRVTTLSAPPIHEYPLTQRFILTRSK
ncbi:hypothetical protein CISG_04351 [Coccidioides immitis RMSCC 3703]|uniref:Uncharacterized protein n=1 Tax=Coccidioides immitis RMSCC 3703 TaxID=454286 RepID=A0A0J8QQY5_COCIT|nr:hypothetical protein CISG_04351 [Coccidioides immitis RMSCC 3703]